MALLTTFNAASTEIYGDQLDVLFEATGRADLLNLSVGYLHATYDEFNVPPEVNIGTPQRDFGGYPLQYAPDWTLSAGYQHDFSLGTGLLRARVETRYEDSFWGTFAQSRGTEQGDYFKSDASLSTPRSTAPGASACGCATSRTWRCSPRPRPGSSARMPTRSSSRRGPTAPALRSGCESGRAQE